MNFIYLFHGDFHEKYDKKYEEDKSIFYFLNLFCCCKVHGDDNPSQAQSENSSSESLMI